jgi:hypothetical protein
MKAFAFLFVLFLVVVCFAQTEGIVKGSAAAGITAQSADRGINSMSDWYMTDSLHIQSGETADVTVATKWGTGILLKNIYNNSGSLAKVYFVSANNTSTQLIKIPEYSHSGKLPPISKIVRTGTADSLLMYFQITY